MEHLHNDSSGLITTKASNLYASSQLSF